MLSVADLELQSYEYAKDLRNLIKTNSHLMLRQAAIYRLCSHLNDSTGWFFSTYQNSTDLHLLTDLDGVILLFNNASLILGPKAVLSGSLLGSWVADYCQDRFNKMLAKVESAAEKRVNEDDIELRCMTNEMEPAGASVEVFGVNTDAGPVALHWTIHLYHSADNKHELKNSIERNLAWNRENVLNTDLDIYRRCQKDFELVAEQILSWAEKTGTGFTIISIYVNGLNSVRERLGVQGREVLVQQLAQRLSSPLRDSDNIARIAENEFLVLANGVSGDWGISQICKKLLLAFYVPIDISGIEFALEGYMGAAEYLRHGVTVSNLIDNSRNALSRVDRFGNNKYEIFERRRLCNDASET